VQAISIGEVLWDIIGSAEHLGGAPFNFALHLRNLGHSVYFISAVGGDERGQRVLSRMHEVGLTTKRVAQLAQYETGTASVLLDNNGQPRFEITHPAAYDFPVLADAEAEQLCSNAPDLIYFGTLFQMSPPAREVTIKVLKRCSAARRLYDVNLRADSYKPDLVRDLMSRATVVKVNEDEVAMITSMFSDRAESLQQFCRNYARQFGWEAVCVTRGAEGCALLVEDTFVTSPGYQVPVADTIGAGDAFAAALAHGLVAEWEPGKIADFANRVGALLASRVGATPPWTLAEAAALRH
jgi:fructokinase